MNVHVHIHCLSLGACPVEKHFKQRLQIVSSLVSTVALFIFRNKAGCKDVWQAVALWNIGWRAGWWSAEQGLIFRLFLGAFAS